MAHANSAAERTYIAPACPARRSIPIIAGPTNLPHLEYTFDTIASAHNYFSLEHKTNTCIALLCICAPDIATGNTTAANAGAANAHLQSSGILHVRRS